VGQVGLDHPGIQAVVSELVDAEGAGEESTFVLAWLEFDDRHVDQGSCYESHASSLWEPQPAPIGRGG
jgi:hypothetical protein